VAAPDTRQIICRRCSRTSTSFSSFTTSKCRLLPSNSFSLNNPFAPQNHEEQRLNQQQNPLASNRLSVYNPNIMLAGALAQLNHQASNNGLNGMVSEDVFVSYIYKSQKDNGLNFGIVNN